MKLTSANINSSKIVERRKEIIKTLTLCPLCLVLRGVMGIVESREITSIGTLISGTIDADKRI